MKMSVTSNPLVELEQLFDRMSRQFDDISRMWESEEPFGRWISKFESMAIDLIEHDDQYVVTVDLPGFERNEIDVQVTDHILRINARYDETIEEQDALYLRHERRRESMRRSIRLPDEVEVDGVKATMKNGVLTITLPKLEAEKARTIDIE